MKITFLFAGTILSSFALANDFTQQVQRAQEQSLHIERKMQELGFKAPDPILPGADGDKPHQASLFRLHSDLSQLRAAAGTMLLGNTVTRLIVGPEGSPAVIELADGQGAFSGLRVLGEAKQATTEGRILIEFDRVVFRNGKTLVLKAVVLDQDGAYGLKAQVFSSKALMVAGAMTSSFISGAAASQQTQMASTFGFSQTQPGARNAILQGAAQTAADQSKRLIEDSTKEKPVLVLKRQSLVQILINEELKF
jgi:hypothetical protein